VSKESPEVQELFNRIAKCKYRAVKFNGIGFRFVGLKYANEDDLLSGAGAGYVGGRWNPRGTNVINASLDPVTATKETYQELIKDGFKSEFFKPRVMVSIQLNVHDLFDLTDAKNRRKIGFPLSELIQEDWHSIQDSGEESWTQAIGRGCLVAGFNGLIVPSARNPKEGKNIAIFCHNNTPGCPLNIIEKENLPLLPP